MESLIMALTHRGLMERVLSRSCFLQERQKKLAMLVHVKSIFYSKFTDFH